MIIAQLVLAALTPISSVRAAAPAAAPSWGVAGFEQRLAAVRKPLHQWTSVSMRVAGGSFAGVSEASLRISLSGSRWPGGVDLNGTVDGGSFSVHGSPFGRDFSLYGDEVNLTLSRTAGGLQLSGSVGERSINLYLNRFGSGWSIWGQGGVNLNASAFGRELRVDGSVDLNEFDRRQLAALGAALAVIAPAK